MSILGSPARLFLVLCSALPILSIAIYIDRNAINIPFFDDWYCCLPAAAQAKTGTLSVETLFDPHNSHRIVFTHLTDILMTLTTDWNLKLELYFTWGLALSILGLAVYLTRISTSSRITWIILVPFSFLTFSFRQNFSWLQALINAMFYCLFFILLAIVLIVRARIGWRTVCMAAILSVCAQFSFLSGLLSWFVLPLALWIKGYRQWCYYVFWGATAACAVALFLVNYDLASLEASQSGDPAFDPLAFILFVLIYIGAPFITPVPDQLPLVIVIGASGLCLLAINSLFILRKTRSWVTLSGWVPVATFVVGTAIMTGLGRAAAHGGYSAAAPRYVTTSSLFWLAFIALSVFVIVGISNSIRWQRGLALVNTAFLFILVPTYLHANYTTVTTSGWVVNENDRMRALLYLVTRDAECLPPLVNNTEEMNIEPQLEVLFRTRLSVFAHPIIDLSWLPLDGTTSPAQARWSTDVIGEHSVPVLVQASDSEAAQTILIPEGSTHPTFLASVSVLGERNNTQGSLDLRFIVRYVAGETVQETQSRYDLSPDRPPQSIASDLSPFIGQTITIVYQTRSSRTGDDIQAVWIAPQLDLGASE
jgi:hypothetical protein